VKRTLILLFTCISLLQFNACKRDTGPSWDVGIVLPLAHASLSIDGLLTDSLTTTNADGSIKLVYSTKFLGLETDTLFKFPDTTVANVFHLPIGYANLAPGTFLIPPSTPTQTEFNVSNVEIVMGILTDGLMTMKFKNDIRKRVIVQYQIPCATLNSIPFSVTFLIPAAPDSLNSSIANNTVSLAGYTIDFTGTNNDRVNTITTLFTAQIDPTEIGNTTIYPSDTVSANSAFSNIKPYYIRGYFGNETIQIGPEETSFSLFNQIQSGSIGLDSLKMSVGITNYLGVDSRLTFNGIWSRNTNTNQTVQLNNSLIGNPININRGVLTSSWLPVIPSTYNFTFDNSNSNAKALIENLPHKLGFDVTLVTNPLGNVSGNNDFFFSDYGIEATLDVEIPLNLFADQLVITDTVIPNFSSITFKENILKGKLTLIAANSFPFDAAIDLYFIDVNGNTIGSLVSQPNTINSGPVTLSGGYLVSTGTANSQLTIPLSESQTSDMLNCEKIVFKANFDTNSNPVYTKIFASNHLDINLSADFDYRIGN